MAVVDVPIVLDHDQVAGAIDEAVKRTALDLAARVDDLHRQLHQLEEHLARQAARAQIARGWLVDGVQPLLVDQQAGVALGEAVALLDTAVAELCPTEEVADRG